MKIQVLDIKGNKAKEITTPLFDGVIREDIVQKIVEAEKNMDKQIYAPFYLAGMQTSASGNVKHNRHVWKTDRGRGMSRFPKKRMSDKGSQFVWVAAAAPGVRGGRRAHPPKLLRTDTKINKKEKNLGFLSGFAMVSSIELLKKKYSKLAELKEMKIKLPIVLEDKILSLKTKDFFNTIRTILGEEVSEIAFQKRSIRAGRGKMRNRKYKKTAGMILIIGSKENKKINGMDIKKSCDLELKDMFANGTRLALFTESAVKELEGRLFHTENKFVKQNTENK